MSYIKTAANPIEPDSLTGAIFALEGVEGATVLLNGPTGCKYYHGSISDSQTFRQVEFDPLNFPMTWYFGQPRVPCTYLDNSDYVYGSEQKLTEALEHFRDTQTAELLCIVNSPGASLIGDDLEGIAERYLDKGRYFCLETAGFSEGYCAGYTTAALALIDALAKPARDYTALPTNDENPTHNTQASENTEMRKTDHAMHPNTKRPSVNIVGMSLYQRYYTGDVQEITRMLQIMGVEVTCLLCAGSSVSDVGNLACADLNIVIHPELGLEIAQHLEQKFGTPYYVCSGPPIGFSAVERFAKDIAQLVGAQDVPLIQECAEARKRAFSYISRINSLTGLPKGVPFGVEGLYSDVYAYTSFLTAYFGMVPVSLVAAQPQADCYRHQLKTLLATCGSADALDCDPVRLPQEKRPELFFGSGATIARMQLAGHTFSGVETMLPTLGYQDVVPKTHWGPTGALRIVEAVLNGLLFKR